MHQNPFWHMVFSSDHLVCQSLFPHYWKVTSKLGTLFGKFIEMLSYWDFCYPYMIPDEDFNSPELKCFGR